MFTLSLQFYPMRPARLVLALTNHDIFRFVSSVTFRIDLTIEVNSVHNYEYLIHLKAVMTLEEEPLVIT